MNFFDIVFYQPSLNIFYGIYLISRDVGFATIFMAFLIRAIMWPFIKSSYITGQKTRRIQPLIKQIQKVYKGDLIKQQEALKKLYAKYEIKASLSGLIILLQLPIYFALFHLIDKVYKSEPLIGLYPFLFGDQVININPVAFGFINITDKGWIVTVLSAFTLVFTFLMTKYIFPTDAQKAPTEKKDKSKSNEPESLMDADVFNKTLQFQMTYFMPVVSFIINLQFPAGLNIYFLGGTIFSFIQQFVLARNHRINEPPISQDEEIVPNKIPDKADQENSANLVLDQNVIEVTATEADPSKKPDKSKNSKNGYKSKQNNKNKKK
jgi:YidC/Oxa1 family membrane protein insertase